MRLATGAATVGCAALIALIFFGRDLSQISLQLDSARLQNFKIVFLSIILEALPFLLVGVLISALLQAFVSDKLIQKLTPKNPIAGILFGSLLGIILPLCECGMIPIVRRLIRKGLPAYIGIIYIVAGPIINPVVFGATFAAFRTNKDLAYSRFYLAFLVSVALGLILYRFMKKNPLKQDRQSQQQHTQITDGHHHHHHHHLDHHHHHGHDHSNEASLGKKLADTPGHAAEEFFDMGKYLILGSFITGLLQTFITRASFSAVADQELLSHLFMMGFAYALSLCSTSDAFVAASFNSMFPPAALLSFLVFGPMLDLKNTLMMLAVFRKKFVLKFSLAIAALVLLGSILFDHLGFV
ncbi:permease [Cohnella luojiensis]|uniref:Permease n=2 Tax=Cohnella luojiensis TaxID=652876 RepID=A0A4Y8LS62_9BACL|nr:permease [Cohnella luojiensis]